MRSLPGTQSTNNLMSIEIADIKTSLDVGDFTNIGDEHAQIQIGQRVH